MSDEGDKARNELDEAHKKASPEMKNKPDEKPGRSNVDDVSKHAGVAEKDKRL